MLSSLPLLAFGMFFLAIGISAFGRSKRRLDDLRSVDAWPAAQGEIVENQLRHKLHKGRELFMPSIRYRYEVNGRPYELDQIKLMGSENWQDIEEAKSRAAEYPLGATGSVFYHPKNPETAYVELVFPRNMELAIVMVPGAYITMGFAMLSVGLGVAREFLALIG